MDKWLHTYFGFNRKEYNGLMTLLVLISLTMLLPYVYGLIKKEELITEAEEQAVLSLILADQQKATVMKQGKQQFEAIDIDRKRTELFIFDPNTIDLSGWERLGLSAKQASGILRYIQNGGKFRKVQDLEKMYTISDAMYDKLSPYVRIADDYTTGAALPQQVYKKVLYEKRIPVVVEINGADTVELDKIKGIGMTFANRIIKYRERIGGFYSKEQLMEVFGLDSAKFNEIKDQVVIDASRIKKINVNTANFEEFKKHPYIRYKQVNALIQYRKQHGNYGNIADLNSVAILDQETIDRIAAYLEF